MSLVAHKYMPEEMPVEELRATFAAREHTLEYLRKSLTDQCDSTTLTSYLITGPRGAGKTTIVLMLCLRIREDERLSAAWLPVRFPEELPGVTSLRDLLAEALHVMAEDGVADAAELHKQVEAEVDDEESLELAVGGLRKIADRQGRRLVLFVENLDLVFDRGLDERTRATLRRLLMDAPFLMIVGTAVHPIQDLAVYDEPFFNYFCPVPLDRLDDAQVRQILFQRAEFDGNEKFREQYQRHQARIKAISRLAGGNPRLILMLYEALAHGNLASTVETLRALVDELTPLLKHVLEHQFSDQQSKILDALMRCGATATPTQVAEAARLRLNTVTTQLSRLKEMQIVEVRGGGKGRPAYYTVPDQLFSTWYQMRYLRRHRRRIELFVDVLCLWFEEEERCRMMNQLAEKARQTVGKTAREAATATEYFAASLAKTSHHSRAREVAVRTWVQIGNLAEAAFALAEDADIQAADRQRYEAAAFAGLGRWSGDRGDFDTAVEALHTAIDRDPNNAQFRLALGSALLVNQQAEASEHFSRVVTDSASGEWAHTVALLGRGLARRAAGDSCRAVSDYTAVIELEDVPDKYVALGLYLRGRARGTQGDTEGAIDDYSAVTNLEGAPVDSVVEALVERAEARAMQGDTEGAIEDCTAVADLEGAPVEKVVEALVTRGKTRTRLGDTEGAIADYTAVTETEGVPVQKIVEALIDRGKARAMQGNTDGAIGDYTAAVELEGVSAEQAAEALVNRANTRAVQGDTEGAIGDYTAAVELEGASAEKVALALVNRAATRGLERGIAQYLDDCLAAVQKPNLDKGMATAILQLAYLVACSEQDAPSLARVSLVASEVFGRVEPAERFEEMESVLLGLTSAGMKSAWPRVLKGLSAGQPPDVVERLEFFRPVAEILETGDLSKLDPLPPEQREFVREVLDEFEAPETEAP